MFEFQAIIGGVLKPQTCKAKTFAAAKRKLGCNKVNLLRTAKQIELNQHPKDA